MAETLRGEKYRGRFKEAPWAGKYDGDILIGGVGGIGSWTTLLLDRAGFNLILYDMDVIEEHNIGGQFYSVSDIGRSKAVAVKTLCTEMSGGSGMLTFNERITDTTLAARISISCFDNMAARRTLFNCWRKNVDRLLFIDGRMSAEGFQIYTVKPGEEEEYEKTLFDDVEVSDGPCSFKATSHTGAIIGGYITAIVTNFITNYVTNTDIREVPKRIELQLPLLMHL